MDDRSTLERAFEYMGRDCAAPMFGKRGTVLIDEFAFLTPAADVTPWTRWKAASCELVNSWAATLMGALYIRPRRNCPQFVLGSSHQVETDAVRFLDNSVQSGAAAASLQANGFRVEFPNPMRPSGKGRDERRARESTPDDDSLWLSATQIANLRLSGLPATARDINILADAGRWIYIGRAPYASRLYYVPCLPAPALDDYFARQGVSA